MTKRCFKTTSKILFTRARLGLFGPPESALLLHCGRVWCTVVVNVTHLKLSRTRKDNSNAYPEHLMAV